MKKTLLLVCLGMFMTNITFSQMSFKGNFSQKSAFDLTENEAIFSKDNFSSNKVLIVAEKNDNMVRSRNSIKRGGTIEGGPFINIGLGYGLGIGSQNLIGFANSTSTTTSLITPPVTNSKQIDVKFGKGLCFNAAVGYMINRNFGFEVGASYLMGGSTTGTNTTDTTLVDKFVDIINTRKAKFEDVVTYKGSMLRINSSIIIASGMDIFNPYAKFGVSLGFGSFSREESINSSNANTSISVGSTIPISDTTITFRSFRRDEYSDGGLSIGFNATLGCNYYYSNNISFFVEFNLLNISFSPGRSEIKEYTVQGVNELPNLSVAAKQTDYSESISSFPDTILPNTVPSKALLQTFSFSSIGLNIGMKISF